MMTNLFVLDDLRAAHTVDWSFLEPWYSME